MIVILNGPKGCGKDTIANMLVTKYGWLKTEFKHDLYVETAKQFNIPVEVIRERNERRDLKDIAFDWNGLRFLSVRQMLIHTSEEVIKPKYGRDYFGLKAARRVLDLRNTELEGKPIVFSDSGFEEERLALIDKLREPIVTIKLLREGYKFDSETDSRSYLSCPDCVVKLVEGKVDEAVESICSFLDNRFGIGEE